MNPDLQRQLAPGQVWIVARTYQRAGEKRIRNLYVILLAAAHPDWTDHTGLHRSHLRHGDLSKYTSDQALDNMEFLRSNPMSPSDWTPNLDSYSGKPLEYREMIAEL